MAGSRTSWSWRRPVVAWAVAAGVIFVWSAPVVGWQSRPAETEHREGTTTRHDVVAAKLAFNQRTLAEDYRRVGRRNPKWDAGAEAMLDGMARRYASAGEQVWYTIEAPSAADLLAQGERLVGELGILVRAGDARAGGLRAGVGQFPTEPSAALGRLASPDAGAGPLALSTERFDTNVPPRLAYQVQSIAWDSAEGWQTVRNLDARIWPDLEPRSAAPGWGNHGAQPLLVFLPPMPEQWAKAVHAGKTTQASVI